MRRKLETEEGKTIYQRRMSTVEPLHGDVQKIVGSFNFSYEDLKKFALNIT